MYEEQIFAETPSVKKAYSIPELKEWGSISEITQGTGGKWKDVDQIWDATSSEAIP